MTFSGFIIEIFSIQTSQLEINFMGLGQQHNVEYKPLNSRWKFY